MKARCLHGVAFGSVLVAAIWISIAGCPPRTPAPEPNGESNTDPTPGGDTSDPTQGSDTGEPDSGGDTVTPCTGDVSGHVSMENTREPMAGVVVSCGGVSTTSSDTGEYALADVPCGTHELLASAPNFRPRTTEVDVVSGEVAAVPVLTLKSTYAYAHLRGTVRDALGHTVGDANITVGACSARSDRSGVYDLCDLPAADHTIRATHELYDDFAATANVPPDTPVASFDITLLGTTLPAPTNLAFEGGWKQVTVTWDALSDPPADRYRIYGAPGNEGAPGVRVLLGESATPAFVHTGLDADAGYYYSVSGVFAGAVEGPRTGVLLGRAEDAVTPLITLDQAVSGLNYAAGRLWWLARLPSHEVRVQSLDPNVPSVVEDRPAWDTSAQPGTLGLLLAVTDDPDVLYAKTDDALCRRTWTGAAYSDCVPITGLPEGALWAMDWRDGHLYVLQLLGDDRFVREGMVDDSGQWTTVQSTLLAGVDVLWGLAVAEGDSAWVISNCGFWDPPIGPPPCCLPDGPVLPHPQLITGVPVCRGLWQFDRTSGAVLRVIPITQGGDPGWTAFAATDGTALYITSGATPSAISRVRTDP